MRFQAPETPFPEATFSVFNPDYAFFALFYPGKKA
jgi:hypothetical protein